MTAAPQSAARFRQRLCHILVATGVTLLFVVLTGAYYLLPRDRSVLLEAKTDELRITAQPETVWATPGAVLCRAAPAARTGSTQSPPASPPADSACGALDRVAGQLERVTWLPGSEFALRRVGHGTPTIEVLAATGSKARRGDESFALESGDLIVLARSYAPLPALGHAVLGAASASGPPVRSGRFEWRETLPLRDRPSLIGSGDLHAGDVVNVALGTCDSTERLNETILVLPFDEDTPGMTVVLSAADADRDTGKAMGLCLARFGFDQTFIEPRLTDRIIADPVIYGLGVFLTAGLTIFPATLGIAELLALRRRRTLPQKAHAKKAALEAAQDPPSAPPENPNKAKPSPQDPTG